MSRLSKEQIQKQPLQPKSRDAIGNKVEVQKGPIRPGERTSKMMTHQEHVNEAFDRAAKCRSGQTLTLHTPKK
jgi:hypothetical protein